MGDELSDKLAALTQTALAARRTAFESLTAADPAQAEWLKAMTAAFGKPDAIEIEVRGEVVYCRGRFGR